MATAKSAKSGAAIAAKYIEAAETAIKLQQMLFQLETLIQNGESAPDVKLPPVRVLQGAMNLVSNSVRAEALLWNGFAESRSHNLSRG